MAVHAFAGRGSVIAGVSYDDDLFRLFVETAQGNVYVYEGVSPDVYETFESAESLGEFWNYTIRPFYRSGGSVDSRPIPEPEVEKFDFVVTYKVAGLVEVRVSAANWDEAAAKAAEQFSDVGLKKEAVSIQKA